MTCNCIGRCEGRTRGIYDWPDCQWNAQQPLDISDRIDCLIELHRDWHVCVNGSDIGSTDYEADSPSGLEPCATYNALVNLREAMRAPCSVSATAELWTRPNASSGEHRNLRRKGIKIRRRFGD